MMLRTRHIRENTQDWGLLKVFQLDEGCRAVARGMGVREFSWGAKLEGYDQCGTSLRSRNLSGAGGIRAGQLEG